jgi:glycerophosphoryl diester phosphodiesterase
MQLIGHRGARFEAPENTLAGFRHAIELGLSAVEFDVRVTRDNELVVIHDATVDRTTDGTGEVSSFSLAELRELDARAEFSDWPEVCRIPTLSEVLDVVDGLPTVLIEIKQRVDHDDPGGLEPVVARIVNEVRDRDLTDRVAITSFDPVVLEMLKGISPELRTGLIGNWDTHAVIDDALRLGAFQGDARHTTTSPEIIAAAQDAGLRMVGWPCNSSAEFEKVSAWGVDAVTTDNPTLILSLLNGTIGD